MQLHQFSLSDLGTHGGHFVEFLRLRKAVLVDGLNWQLPNDGSLEMDQYDHPLARYSLVEHQGRIVAGARALPCNARWNNWTYMLLDAHLNRLPNIPNDLLDDYPNDNLTWECTRLVLDEKALSAQHRNAAFGLVVAGLCNQVSEAGGAQMLSLSPVVLGRLLGRFGYDVRGMGKVYNCPDDLRRYTVFSMPCDKAVGLKFTERCTLSAVKVA